MSKFRVLLDYGSDGFSLAEDGFSTVDEAIRYAVKNYTSPFLVVEIAWSYDDKQFKLSVK